MRKHKISFVTASVYALLLLVVGSWVSIFIVESASLSLLFSEKNLFTLASFLRGF
ncbi:hypothetical protein JCM21738_1453 [Mesobacillus boroniphilus JCM 21738]|uniref:Uncharacterized protein n=1 Tax=Mesobacillus boroniphilus JCM 21738 TaxID=1294265 RepID=W4RJV3_9BACI|nr:hypothetical protein JCM21738_1453 [Mesobacillus boroniphilus JCM 21738]